MAELLNNVAQEICAKGDVACLNRNVARLTKALEVRIKAKIDDQSEGIAFMINKLQNDINTQLQNKIEVSKDFIGDKVNAVFSKVEEQTRNIDGIDYYLRTEQMTRILDINFELNELKHKIDRYATQSGNNIKGIESIMKDALKDTSSKIQSKVTSSANVIKTEIKDHHDIMSKRFDKVTFTLNEGLSNMSQNINEGLRKQTTLITDKNKEVTRKVNEYNKALSEELNTTIQLNSLEDKTFISNLVKDIKLWIEELVDMTPDKLADTLKAFKDVSSKIVTDIKDEERIV